MVYTRFKSFAWCAGFALLTFQIPAGAAEDLITADLTAVDNLLKTVSTAKIDLPTGDPFSLQDALITTYSKNPQIEAARKQLRAVDETYAQAMSGFRPSVLGDASYQSIQQDGNITGDSHDDPKVLLLQASQSLYSGGSTQANVKAAESRILAQRSSLRSTEQRVLLDAITTYMDVLRDQEILMLTVNNETVLANELKAARERFRLGDITITDVLQSQTRLSAAIADRVAAQSSLKQSRAAFESIVWIYPGNLMAPNIEADIPATLEEALAISEKNNPDISFSQYAIAAAAADTRSILGEKLPQVGLTGQLGRTYDPALSRDSDVDSSSILVRATFPLYTAGSTDSRIRQAKETESQRHVEMHQTARSVRESVIDAWETLMAAKAQVETRKVQIESARQSRDGVKSEADYGARTTLDVLNAEQEYLNAQVAYESAEHDRVVASFSVMSAMGQLQPVTLKLKVEPYNAERHFKSVKNKWYGTSVEN